MNKTSESGKSREISYISTFFFNLLKKKKKKHGKEKAKLYKSISYIYSDRDYYLRVTDTSVTEVTQNPTAIQDVRKRMEDEKSVVFDLQGRNVGTTTSHLPKGIYIVNGKKRVIQ